MSDSPDKKESKDATYRPWYSTVLIIGGVIVFLFPFLTEAYGFFVEQQLNEAWDQAASQQEEAAREAEEAQERLAEVRLLPEEEKVLSQKLLSSEVAEQSGATESKSFPKTRIIIPKIELEQVVLEGVTPQILKKGPGHYPGMVNPGAEGNLGIAGHRVTFTKPFNRLDELSEGDLIVVETLDYRYEYQVTTSKIVSPKDVTMLGPTAEAVVTLTTCHPKFSARYRLNVRGKLHRRVSKRPSFVRLVREEVESLLSSREKVEAPPQTAQEFEIWQAEELVKARPASAAARLELGSVYMKHDRLEEAAEELEAAVSLEPKAAEPHYFLALLFQEERKWDEAISEFQIAISLNPELEVAYHELGLLYLDKGQYADALAMFKQSVAFSPMAADGHFYLGQVYEEMGEETNAAEEYREALRFNPQYQKAQAALERVSE